MGRAFSDLGGGPPVRAGFLERPWRRIVAAILGGIAAMILGGLLVQELFFSACNGPCTIGYAGGFLGNLSFSIYFVALFPPFVPALLPSGLLTRGGKEGAIAGFVAYLIPAVQYGIPSFTSNCPYCALIRLYSVGTPFLGALVGAGGGALGGWVRRRRMMSANEVKPKDPTESH